MSTATATPQRIDIKYIDTTPVICRIDYDEWSENPREWDNLGRMTLSHRNYDFENVDNINFDDFDGWDEVKAYLKKELKAVVILPVQMYEHSGVRIYVGSSHDQWDGGQLGFIYATKEDILKEYGGKRVTGEILEKTIAVLTNEVDNYSKYIDGQVYSVTLEDSRGNFIDSCGGFYSAEEIRDNFNLDDYESIEYVGDASHLLN